MGITNLLVPFWRLLSELMTLKKLVKPSNIRPELVVHVKKKKED